MTPEIAREAAEIRQARNRELAAARQRRRRARLAGQDDVTVTVPVTSPVVTQQPSRRVVRVSKDIAQGVPTSRALENAGFNKRCKGVADEARAVLQAELHAAQVGIKTIVVSVADALQANAMVVAGERCIERPDWAARSSGRRDAIALADRAGILPPSPAITDGPKAVSITYNYIQYVRQVGAYNPDEAQAIDVTPRHDSV